MLVGRDRELRAIDEALASARVGRSTRLVIHGEPGMGKTALLDHAAATAGEMQLLRARGVEFEADLPFAGLHELVGPALGSLERLPSVHAAALRSSLGLGARIEADRLIVGAAVLGLIAAHAERGPVLVLIDDAHWVDRASAEAIAFAARRLFADPVAVLIAVRDGEESPFLEAGLPGIELRGLDEDSAARLLGGEAAEAGVVERMVRATGGNPLALLEMRAGTASMPRSPLDDLPVATSVERAYLRRVEGLGEDAKRVLLLVAAAGVPDAGLIERAAAAMGIAASAVDAAVDARSLIASTGDRLEFVHPLARAAIYHAAAPAQRRAAHRALAGATPAGEDPDRRAWHLAAAAPGHDEEAAAALEEVAERARESTGYDAASSALVESARLTEGAEARCRRLLGAAANAWLAGRADRALKLLDEARPLATTAAATTEIDNLAGHIAMRRGAVAEGHAMLVAAARAIESSDRLKAVRMLSDAALSAFAAGHPRRYVGAAETALALVRDGDPPESRVFALVSFAALAVMAGRGADGPARLRESVPLFDAVPADSSDALFLACEGMAGLYLREAEAGRDLLDRALNQARERAPAAALPVLEFMLGRDAAATDRWQVARVHYEEGVRLARETTQSTWLTGSIAGLAWLDALEGRQEECRAHAAEALELADRYGMGFFRAWALIALGQLELGLGDPAAALERFVECDAFLAEIEIDDPDIAPAPDIVDALVRLGRTDDARAALRAYVERAEAKGQPFALARAARARGLLAADGEYAAQFEAALRHHESTPDVFERARTELYFGERLRRSRRRVDARVRLHAALRAFDRLGAAPWAERAIAELKASGETARVRDETSRQQLTPQELQVALMLAEGLTTREAAGRLYLSPKTVEYHLRHVYDKLEVRTRDELRAVLLPPAARGGERKALLFTDLAGSTRLVEAIGDAAWRELSTWLDGEMRKMFAQHRGREVDHAGDGFFVVFDHARDAIECAVAIQRRLAGHRRTQGYAPQVRIGIHEGEVQLEGSSIRGAAVHRAARLGAAARPDTILVSREAMEAAGRRPAGLRELTLKGIGDKVLAAEVAWTG